jgi:mono/diheme cytochrome c family protein
MKSFCLSCFASLLLLWAGQQQQRSAPAPLGDVSLQEQGRKVFVSHCGKCHDEDANKKLPDGTTLISRLAVSKDPKALLATRLKSMSEADRRGVSLYMDGLLARRRSPEGDAGSRTLPPP